MKKKLYRNLDENLLGGVLAGLADYTDNDVTLIRLLAIVLIIISGLMPGVLIYLIAWIVIPAGPGADSPIREAEYTTHE